jgi:glycosyltransferase involved in cell wall biosynthesis
MSQEIHPIPPQKGAAVEQWMDAVAHRISRYEPHLVSVPHPSRPDSEAQGHVHYRRIRMGNVYKRLFRKLTRLDPYSYTDRIIRYARSISPAILHMHNAPQFVDAMARGLPEAKIILHMHNEKTDAVRTRVAALAGCSGYIRNWYQARGFPAERFAVLDNGVDIAAHASVRSSQTLHDLRKRHDIPAERFVVLYVGRISPEKGPDLAAHAMQHLDPRCFHLVLVGEWPQGSVHKSERVRHAEDLREQLGKVPHTIVGAVPPQQMPGIYALGDVLLVPSKFEEPFSMVAIEAMAAGLPVMALKKGGMPEYMVDGDNALLLEAQASAQDIARAIEKAAGNPPYLEAVAASARKLVEQRFDWSRVATATERLYDEVLSAPGKVTR